MLIYAKNKVSSEVLSKVETPKPTQTHTPIAHHELVDMTRKAIGDSGLEIINEEHGLSHGSQRYFGGFALRGESFLDENGGQKRECYSQDRQLVLGLRNSHDKSLAAGIAVGNQMLVCDNLCFSSDVTLARKHTTYIMNDLYNRITSAISQVTSHWTAMENRINKYKNTEVKDASKLVLDLFNDKVFGNKRAVDALQEFHNPRHEEFKGGSLWTLYNAVTESLKGIGSHDISNRTMRMQSVFDKSADFTPAVISKEDRESALVLPA